MIEEKRYTVIDKASFRPDKIVFYKQFIKNNSTQLDQVSKPRKDTKEFLNSIGVCSKKLTLSNKHNFEISKKASSRIKEKVTWLYTLAKPKTVVLEKGKNLYSFKMNFITLTLPALQKHTTEEITKECLNQFLTECKNRFGLANYVWRLEFQKNGNAHYHIATDCFIEYWRCKSIWNRCLQKLGYIEDYSKKFRGMSFEDYRKNYQNEEKTNFEKLRLQYAKGCAERWLCPNTVDVRAVSNAKNISFYISKYITKPSEHSLNEIVKNREPEATNLRLWFCSRSLSKLDKIELFLEECNTLAEDCFNKLSNLKKYVFEYCTVFYFKQSEQLGVTKRLLWLLYNQYGKSKNYIPAK